jgi:antirestriction protein ArdC
MRVQQQLLEEAPIHHDASLHAVYVQSWIEALKNHNSEIFRFSALLPITPRCLRSDVSGRQPALKLSTRRDCCYISVE